MCLLTSSSNLTPLTSSGPARSHLICDFVFVFLFSFFKVDCMENYARTVIPLFFMALQLMFLNLVVCLLLSDILIEDDCVLIFVLIIDLGNYILSGYPNSPLQI